MESLAPSPSPSLDQMLQAPLSPTCTNPTFQVTSASTTAYHNTPTTTPHDIMHNGHISSNTTEVVPSVSHEVEHQEERYQYILGAATSIATRVNEESLSYLNQGQSYEIKVKKLGDLTRCQGTLYHTLIRICFHERRLQNMEKEQLANWQQVRPGERILEIDTPLSYGITDVVEDSNHLNVCEFDWDPTKEVGVYVKVNCISTEFTPKKHGGEKGVPFRIQVETYGKSDSSRELLHVCACQIKVFKLKGADRKHKQDRERISKRPQVEQEKYQKPYECTILTELSPECVYIPNHEIQTPVLPPPPPPPPTFVSQASKPTSNCTSSSQCSTNQEAEDETDGDSGSPVSFYKFFFNRPKYFYRPTRNGTKRKAFVVTQAWASAVH